MADRVKVPLTFQEGLLEQVEDSMVPMGGATRLENWFPEASGNLRCRPGWKIGSLASVPAIRRVKGFGRFATVSSYQTPTRRQEHSVASPTGTSHTIAWPQATLEGSLLLMAASVQGPGTVTTPTGWTLLGSNSAQSTARTFLYAKFNAASESGSAAALGTPNVVVNLALFEYTGLAGSPLDKGANTSGSTASPSTGTTLTTEQEVELAIGIITDARSEAQTSPTNSFTKVLERQHGGGNLTLGAYERVVTAMGTFGTAVTTATSDPWSGLVATFKAKAATATASSGFYMVANDDGSSHKIYLISGDNVASGVWSLIDTLTNVGSFLVMGFTSGLGNILYTSPHLSAVRAFNGTTASDVADAPKGRAIAFHKNRFFISGDRDEPSKLHFSALADHTDWTSANNAGSINITKDDGDAINDIAPFSDGLLIAKENSLHFLSGSGVSDFQVNRLNGGGGAAGRCICVTPYGALIAGLKQVWMWTGGGVELISKPIEDSYEITGEFCSSAYIDDVAYICDEGTGIVYAFHIPNGTWWIEKHSDSGARPGFIWAHKDKLVQGPKNSTVYGLLNYRMVPPASRGRDATYAQSFALTTPAYWPGGSEQVVTPLHLHLKLRQHGGGPTETGLVVTPIYDQVEAERVTVTPRDAAGVYRVRADIGSSKHGRGISSVQFRLDQTVAATGQALFDIEEAVLEFDLEEMLR